MADLDTALKRRVWHLPIPNGSISEDDRRLIGIGYAGLAVFEALWRDTKDFILYIQQQFSIVLYR